MPFLPIIRLIYRILCPFFQKNIKIRVFSKKNVKKKKKPCQATPTPSSERVSTHIPIFPQIQYKNQKNAKICIIWVKSSCLKLKSEENVTWIRAHRVSRACSPGIHLIARFVSMPWVFALLRTLFRGYRLCRRPLNWIFRFFYFLGIGWKEACGRCQEGRGFNCR